MTVSRRQLLAGAGLLPFAAIAAPVSAAEKKRTWPAKPTVPTDFNPEEFFVELAERGTGLVIGNKNAKIEVSVVFDTQCPWCVWLYNQFKPFEDRVKFNWYPTAVLNSWSELQGAAIISSADPVKTFLEHEAHFKDEFRGLDVRGKDFPFETKKKVWQNSKIARHAGTRVVPFAVVKTADGRYVPFAKVKGEEFAKLAGL
ncbi:MAG: hypothetical protein ACI4SY_03040 [Sutterella sp.]